MRRLEPEGQELPFRRIECAPGQKSQADLGKKAWVKKNRRRRGAHIFRCVLGFSCKDVVAEEAPPVQPDTGNFSGSADRGSEDFRPATARRAQPSASSTDSPPSAIRTIPHHSTGWTYRGIESPTA